MVYFLTISWYPKVHKILLWGVYVRAPHVFPAPLAFPSWRVPLAALVTSRILSAEPLPSWLVGQPCGRALLLCCVAWTRFVHLWGAFFVSSQYCNILPATFWWLWGPNALCPSVARMTSCLDGNCHAVWVCMLCSCDAANLALGSCLLCLALPCYDRLPPGALLRLTHLFARLPWHCCCPRCGCQMASPRSC